MRYRSLGGGSSVGGILVCLGLLLVGPKGAWAQYKNTAFGLDGGFMMLSKPGLIDDQGYLLDGTQRPIRLANGPRLGLEANFKMDDDHWWLSFRANAAFLRFAMSGASELERQFDSSARSALGTVLGAQGLVGTRYVILTDRIRPYVQIGVSYMYLFTFTGLSSNPCDVLGLCDDGGTFGDNFLSHRNVFAAHFEPGAEIFLSRDMALHVLLELQHWLVLGAQDNNVVTLGLGLTFFG